MRKFLLILLTACTTSLLANTPPVENPPTTLTSPIYPTSQEPKKETSNGKKATAAVIGTIAAITIGLLVSGSDTGEHIKSKKAS